MIEAARAALRWRDTYGNRWWRIENLYKIRSKDKKLVIFKPNRIQQYIFSEMRKQVDHGLPLRQLLLKYRQGGASTSLSIYYLDDTIFHEATITGILANQRENLGYLFEIPRLAHEHMPPGIRPELGDDSKTALSFPEINSKMFVSLAIRSTAVHNLLISEAAHAGEKEIQATLGSVPPSANIFMETTAAGSGNDFYTKYQEAKIGKNTYNRIFIPWFLQEEYRMPTLGAKIVRTPEEQRLTKFAARDYKVDISDEQIVFRRQKERDLKRLRPQEFPENDVEAFLTAGVKFFDGKKILTLLKEAEAIEPVESGEGWIMWEKPQKNCVYVAGADPAEGGDGDYSALAIINATTRKVAFRLRAHLGVDAFARECAQRCRQFLNAKLAVERNNHGHAVLLALRELEKYTNLYYEQKANKKVIGFDQKERKYGWRTDNASRPLMLDQLKFALEGDSLEDEHTFEPQVLVYDGELLDEALNFEQVNGKYQAAAGHHDDLVMAYAMAWQMYLRCGKSLVRRDKNALYIGGEREVAKE